MEEAIEQLNAKDTKERLAGVERLQMLLEQSRKGLSSQEVSSLVDASLGLLRDNNFRVCQGTLQALASAAALAGEHLKLHFNALLPAIVERLGDGKQPVRDAGRRLLLALMEISSPSIVVDRAGSYAWSHKNWRVREEFARTVASAINLFAATELPFQRLLLPSVLQLLEDSNSNAREAAILCLEEMYRQGGSQFREELQQHQLRPTQLKDIIARFDKIEPRMRSLDTIPIHAEHKGDGLPSAGSNRRSSPRNKPVVDLSSIGGDLDGADKPADPVKIHSEKELMKEVEKAAAVLTPERDWSARITAMQKIEGLVYGGATDYACFPGLLKQLVGPLTVQLSDRRSSIVKQVCHLLSLLSKELLSDFEPYAESFIPVLFKLVVITVQIIAESADSCIKTMLRNCRVSRVLPKILEHAKHDRNAVLRARCSEYALLVLEQWPDAPEIHRAAEQYEDFLKCCTTDAMSEVRSTARQCYRLFTRSWPERSRRLYQLFDPTVQRIITEEEGNLLKRYVSPALRDGRGPLPLRQSGVSGLSSAGSGITTADHASSGQSTTGTASLSHKTAVPSSERSLESVLHASQQQVNAIETLLRGVEISEKGSSSTSRRIDERDPVGGSYRKIHAAASSVRTGVDPPSARDPPHPASAPALPQGSLRASSLSSGNVASIYSRGNLNAGAASMSGNNIQMTSSMDSTKGGGSVSGHSRDGLSALGAAKRVPMSNDRLSHGNLNEGYDGKGPRRLLRADSQLERGVDNPFSSLPGFQRPLLRSTVSGRSLGSSRNSVDENQMLAGLNSFGESFNYLDGLMSLNDALTEGLSAGADWSARVAAFSYLKKLLHQGPKGVQEVSQCFERVMNLFSEHLDDPHHKVAQAALSTLVELVPACRKLFEAYLERIIPHVFARLVDAKEVIRQLGTSALEIVGNTYSIDSLLPALLRSLDEQRSPKAKIAVIEFAIAAFAKLALNGEAAGGSGLLKLWLAKLAPLANEKNPKLKETAVTGIISVYSHFDSTTVLNFILGLSIEEQSLLRRALKQYTPRIEVDLMTYLQNRSQRVRPKSLGDQSEVMSPTLDEGYGRAYSAQHKNQGPSSGSSNADNGRKWSSAQSEPAYSGNHHSPGYDADHVYPGYYEFSAESEDQFMPKKSKDEMNEVVSHPQRLKTWSDPVQSVQQPDNYDKSGGACIAGAHGFSRAPNVDGQSDTSESKLRDKFLKNSGLGASPQQADASVTKLLHQMSHWSDDKPAAEKSEALQEVLHLSRTNNNTAWCQYLNQILTVVLEALDDSDPAIRELDLSVILEMLSNQRERFEEATEVLLEKLLHATKDSVARVSSAADRCLHALLTQYDPYRCLAVLVPLLVSEDQKTLVTCISSLTKLVSRLPSEELMAQLPSFLPALFDAFGNQNADVRKTVVFCLVDIYIVLGKAFVPYLGSLSSTQLRLVTIYANRISQARTGNSLDAPL